MRYYRFENYDRAVILSFSLSVEEMHILWYTTLKHMNNTRFSEV